MTIKIGRNNPCPCGSGEKFKVCCIHDIPSSEKDFIIDNIKQKIEEGYGSLADNQLIKACNKWWQAWRDIRRWLLPHYQSNSIEAFSSQITGDSLLCDWIQDFEDELENAGKLNPRFYELRYILAFKFRKYFPNSDEMILMKMGTAAAQALFQLGRMEEGEILLKKMIIGDYTENARGWIYIRWGDIYSNSDKNDTSSVEKAKRLYSKALDLLNKENREIALIRLDELNYNE